MPCRFFKRQAYAVFFFQHLWALVPQIKPLARASAAPDEGIRRASRINCWIIGLSGFLAARLVVLPVRPFLRTSPGRRFAGSFGEFSAPLNFIQRLRVSDTVRPDSTSRSDGLNPLLPGFPARIAVPWYSRFGFSSSSKSARRAHFLTFPPARSAVHRQGGELLLA